VSDGRFASYLLLMWLLGIGAASYFVILGHRLQKVVFGSIAIIFTAITLSGSRGIFVHTLASTLVLATAFLWGAPWRWQKGYRLVKALRTGFGLASAALLATMFFFPSAVGARWAFYYESLAPDSPQSELVTRAWDYPIQNFLKAFTFPDWPWGYGIGTASLGSQYITRILQAPSSWIGVESGYGNIMLETGILGVLLWLVWTVALVVSGLRLAVKLRGSAVFPVGFSIVWYAFLLLFPFTYGTLVFYQNFVLNAYLWVLVGILFRLPFLGSGQGQAARV